MSFYNDHQVVVCRPAIEKDKEAVLELCSHIWEGGDYIPSVWDEWLAAPEGMLGVAEMGGRLVGVFKLTRFQEHEWYMEGLRVHPDVQGRGIAAHIHEYVMETWRRTGKGLIRLATGSYNVKVHHMCEGSGFTRIAEFIPYRAPIIPAGTDRFTALGMGEAPTAFEFIASSPVHALSGSLINLGWVFADLQLKQLEDAIHAGHAWWWMGGRGFLSIWEDEEDDRNEPGIQLVACPLVELPELLEDYRRLMSIHGYSTAGWVAPNRPEAIASLEQAGFTRSWDMSLYIYELRS